MIEKDNFIEFTGIIRNDKDGSYALFTVIDGNSGEPKPGLNLFIYIYEIEKTRQDILARSSDPLFICHQCEQLDLAYHAAHVEPYQRTKAVMDRLGMAGFYDEITVLKKSASPTQMAAAHARMMRAWDKMNHLRPKTAG